MAWILIDYLKDDERIYKGTCIWFYDTDKGLAEHCALPVNDIPLDYMITEAFGDGKHFQLTCLTEGEAGNITCVLKRENSTYFVTGKEIKRMLQTDLYKIFINKRPKIDIK